MMKSAKKTKRVLAKSSISKAVVKKTYKSTLLKRLKSHGYLVFSLIALILTTVFWSYYGAKINSYNADQLVNPFLFDGKNTLGQALLPGQHSQLIKWPIFWLVSLAGNSETAFLISTMLLCLITVLLFAYLLSRIERRPNYLAAIYMGLSGILLMVPATPYPGALLPVNMAMLSTRNIEYIVFLASLYFFVRAKNFRSFSNLVSIFILMLLIMSDKLFLSLSLGTGIIISIVYGLKQAWPVVSLGIRWFISSITATMLALTGLAVISKINIVNIVGQGNNPYPAVSGTAELFKAIFFGITSILTNFGANPSYDNIQIKHFPVHSFRNILSLGGPLIILNLALLAFSAWAAYKFVKYSLKAKTKKTFSALDQHQLVTIFTLAASSVTIIVYTLSSHYYAADARYLAITMFGLLMSVALVIKKSQISSNRLLQFGATTAVLIFLALPGVAKSYQEHQKVNRTIELRNTKITEILKSHQVNNLLGDYWRVLPIKKDLPKQRVTPLEGCFDYRSILTNKRWLPDLRSNSFAYLLTTDVSPTGRQGCSLELALKQYGKPNLSLAIEGSLDSPRELLLFYDHGLNHQADSVISPGALPIAASDLNNTTCDGPTSVNVLAHPDDDLLFMNPDIMNDISSGKCVRSIYLTSGDAGNGNFYWLSREQGIEAAYNQMIGHDSLWIERNVRLNNDKLVAVAYPKNYPKVTLIFLRLPDGNVHGQGFLSRGGQSLKRLTHNQNTSIKTIYGDNYYNFDSLKQSLVQILNIYNPVHMRTLSTFYGANPTEHSDHVSTAVITEAALKDYNVSHFDNNLALPLTHYFGYTVHSMAANVSGQDREKKVNVFLSYAKFDNAVCQTEYSCLNNDAYGSYLSRQYPSDF